MKTFSEHLKYLSESRDESEFSDEVKSKLQKAGFAFNSIGAYTDFFSGSKVDSILLIVPKEESKKGFVVDIELHGNKIKEDDPVESLTGVILTDETIKKIQKFKSTAEKYIKAKSEYMENFYDIE